MTILGARNAVFLGLALLGLGWATVPQERPLGGVTTAAEAEAAAAAEPEEDVAFREVVVPLIQRHCVSCHGPLKMKAGLDLSLTTTGAAVRGREAIWRKVITQVRSGAMPPGAAAGFDEEDRASVWQGVHGALVWRDPSAPPDPGVVTLRRLNSYEYDRTVEAVFGVTFDARRTFPAEPAAYGFDNIGDVMFLSPMLVEKYYDATQEIAARLFEDPAKVLALVGAAGEGEDEAPSVERGLRRLMQRAFRRPATDDEVASRRELFQKARERGSYVSAWRPVVESLLLSPHFLFRVEEERETKEPWALSGWEVATRLAYLMWSAPPDDALWALAESGALLEPGELERQVDRMLKDPRARALADHFAAQWLGFRDILTHAVDVRRFSGFHDHLRNSLYEESAQFFMGMIEDDAPVTRLLSADFTYLNEALAKHYGIAGVKGSTLRRVKLDDPERGGVLGMGSILTVTSYPLRTSPVVRGKWVMETLLGAEAPPPPADAGMLPKDDEQKDGLSLRERLLRHRREPRCASCHREMDAFGLALERFDGVGRQRTESLGQPIDAKTELPGGVVLDGPAGLKAWLLTQKGLFVRSLTESVLVYALGREVQPSDESTVKGILERLDQNDLRIRTLLKGVVTSHPFLHKRKP